MPNHLQFLFLASLILLGLSPSENTYPNKMSTSASFSVLAQIAALLVAAASGVFIYLKFVRKPVLDPKEWQLFPLKQKIVVSPNTAIYRFALPHPSDSLGLPIGQHITVSAEINGKDVARSYTPTSSDDDLGHFDLLIKSYEKGNISRYVSLLKIGDKIRVKGPKGQFNYSPTLSREIGMIAGGTGITPMLQIIRAALKNPQDHTRLSLIYANVFYVLNNPPMGWTGGVGFVSKEQIATHSLPPMTISRSSLCVCVGPPPMMTGMKKHLDELKYPAPRTVSKLVDQVGTIRLPIVGPSSHWSQVFLF
ncbi:hypothetical protein BJV77DRAFT_1057699 [Russula vinacea]|nr:hypothetical protein BJV77DRAFT_1057699 [Russula vinacea]